MDRVRTWRAKIQSEYDRDKGKKHKEKELILGDIYQSIQDQALKNNVKIKDVELAPTIRVIGKQSFYNCTALRKINLENVCIIRQEAFYGNIKLIGLQFSNNLKFIGKAAFMKCKHLQTIDLEKTLISELESGTFQECENIEQIIFPYMLEKIGNRCFSQCSNLKSIVLPENNLKSIGKYAFSKCKGLEEVTIPKSVESIGEGAFRGCNRLKRIEILGDPKEVEADIINKNTIIRCERDTNIERYCQEAGYTMEYRN